MKITKAMVATCLLTFSIGCLSVVAYISLLRTPQEVSVSQASVIDVPRNSFAPQTAAEVELEPEEDDWSDASKYKIRLLQTGEVFHGDEVDAKNDEIWLGLFEENGQYHLRSTRLKVRRVYDEIFEEHSGKSVKTQYKAKSVFLLKNAKTLRQGAVETFFRGLSYEETDDFERITHLKQGLNQKHQINNKSYTLRVVEAKTKENESVLKLILETEGLSQVLHSMKGAASNYLGTLYWVGDLDRDGKPDLFVDLYVHDNVSYRNLFLSSQAEENKLVKKIAIFATTGC